MEEAVVDIGEAEEARVEDCGTSPQKIADPVVYQLVRVDGDGRLVPATDDEVMAVEDLIEDDKSKGRIIQEAGHTPECSTGYDHRPSSLKKVQFKGSDGLPQFEVPETGEENSNANSNAALGCSMDFEGMDVQHEESVPSVVPNTSHVSFHQSWSSEGSSKLSGGSNDTKTSNSVVETSLKPDFSLLKGEICLDNLTVRDLQETFKATFGRETSVKDKQWLKRRIIMGLTNSCDFSTTTFVIIDDRVVKKEETCKSADSSDLVDCVVTSQKENHGSPSTFHDKQNEIHRNTNGKKMQSSVEDDCGSKDAGTEKRPTKRVRKPTKRYIEELSEEESKDSGAKLVSSVKHPVHDQPSAKDYARPLQNIGLDGRCFTRMDSLGGSGVQVPYVSRIRRSRPRDNFITLMKLQPSGMGMPTRLGKNNFACSEDESCNKVFKSSSSPRSIQDHPVASNEICEPHAKKIRLEKEVNQSSMESYRNSSDDEVITVRASNGGIRRKHHRPWTLSEVVKLVEGVAKYGAGRWSEIKRVAFASYSYRTSVDLKDKWRNLLRASAAESPTGNGINCSRKQASVPIPASILSRVRELADIQTQVPPSFSSSKLAGHMGINKTAFEMGTRSGFL